MSDNNKSGGIGFASLLLIAFIVLKLCHVINWSWWWVLSPFWIPLGIVVIILAIAGTMSLNDFKKEEKKVEKSKWQQRMEDIQKKQKQEAN